MKDNHYCPNKHPDSNTIIYKTPVDKDIKPIIKWLNSLDGIFTRWSCQGDDNKPCQWPYIVIWIETMEETHKEIPVVSSHPDVYPQLLKYLKTYPQITIRPLCTKGDIHSYYIRFNSHKDMMKIRNKLIKWQPKDTYQLVEKIAL